MATKPLIINAGRFEQLSDGEGLDVGGWTLPTAGGTENYALIADVSGNAVWDTIDHGGLTGLVDDDHPQYHNKTGWVADFAQTGDATISVNNGTLTLSITPTGANFEFWVQGIKYTKTTQQDVVFTDTEGVWYFYFNASGTLTASQTSWDFKTNNFAGVCIGYWDATNNLLNLIGPEYHSYEMDPATHEYLHYTFATRWSSGLGVAINGDNLDIGAGHIYDEDIDIYITDSVSGGMWQQDLTPASLPIFYRTGSGIWRKIAASTTPVYLDTNIPQINTLSGTWGWVAVNTARYFVYWVIATNDQSEPVILIPGQEESTTLNATRSGNSLSDMLFGNLPEEEHKVIARVIMQRDGSTPYYSLIEVNDYRNVSDEPSSGGAVIGDHNNLIGLGDDDHPQYVLNTGETSSVDLGSQTFTTTGTVVGSNIPAPTVDDQILISTASGVASWSTAGNNKVLASDGAGGVAWTTVLTGLTSLTVDNITINGAIITSDTGAISFNDENLSTSGTVVGSNIPSPTVDDQVLISTASGIASWSTAGNNQYLASNGSGDVAWTNNLASMVNPTADNQLLESTGSGTAAWTDTLDILKVDNITIDGSSIVSSTNEINFVDENLSTTGMITSGKITANHSIGDMGTPTANFTRINIGGGSPNPVMRLEFEDEDDIIDGTGPGIQFDISDVAAGPYTIAGIYARRREDDDESGSLDFYTYSSGVVTNGGRFNPDGSFSLLKGLDVTGGPVTGSNIPSPTVDDQVLISTASDVASWSTAGNDQYLASNGSGVVAWTDKPVSMANPTADNQLLVATGADAASWTTTLDILTVDNITINDAIITSDTGAISFNDENLSTSGTVVGSNIPSPTIDDQVLISTASGVASWSTAGTDQYLASDGSGEVAWVAKPALASNPTTDDQVLISTAAGAASWSTAGTDQVLASDGSGEVAWTNKSFGDSIPANSAANEIYVGTGVGTAAWTTNLAGLTSLTVDNITIDGATISTDTTVISFDDPVSVNSTGASSLWDLQVGDENSLLRVGSGTSTSHTILGNKQKDELGANEYETYLADNAFWDTVTLEWLAVRTTLGNRAKFSMGYHRNSFAWDYQSATGSAVTWSSLMDLNYSTGVLTVGGGISAGSLTIDNITINGAIITSDTGAISFNDENLSTSGTVVGSNIPSPTIDDQVLISTSAGAASWSTAGTDQVLASDGSGEVAWTNKSFGDSIPANSAANEIYVGTGVGTAAWTTNLAGLTSLTVDNITINGAIITSDTGAISFNDENLSTSGTVVGSNIPSPTVDDQVLISTASGIASWSTAGNNQYLASNGSGDVAWTNNLASMVNPTADNQLLESTGSGTAAWTDTLDILKVDNITIDGSTISTDTDVVSFDDPVSINSPGVSSLYDLQVGYLNGKIRIGYFGATAHTVIGNKQKDEGDANEYEAYFSDNAYWNPTALEWLPVRSTLGKRAKFSMGYHRNAFIWEYHSATGSTITWSSLMNLNYSTGVLTVGGGISTSGTVVGTNIPSPTTDDQALSSTASGVASWNVTCLADVLAQEVPSASGAERKFVLTANSASQFEIESAPWTIAITTDETVYVRTTGNDTIGNGSIGSPFLTLERTIEYLGGLYIGDYTITVDIGEGVFTEAGTLSFQHPFGAQVTWQGVSEQITSQDTNSISASGTTLGHSNLYRYDVTMILPVGKSVSVGDYIAIRSVSGGTLPESLQGCHYVSAWDSGTRQATIQIVYHDGAPKATGTVTCTIELIKTVIAFSNKNGLKTNGPYHAGNWKGLVIQGNYSSANTSARYGAWMLNTSVLTLGGSSDSGAAIGIVGFQTGVYAQNNAMVFGDYCFISRCGTRCANAQNGGILNLRYARLSGANNNGIFAFNGSTVAAASAVVVAVGNDSIYSYQGSFIDAQNAYIDQNNATNALTADRWSGIDANGSSYTDSISPSTPGNNDGSYVIIA